MLSIRDLKDMKARFLNNEDKKVTGLVFDDAEICLSFDDDTTLFMDIKDSDFIELRPKLMGDDIDGDIYAGDRVEVWVRDEDGRHIQTEGIVDYNMREGWFIFTEYVNPLDPEQLPWSYNITEVLTDENCMIRMKKITGDINGTSGS